MPQSHSEELDGPILLTADTDTGAAVARAIAQRVGPRVQAGARPIDHWFTIAPVWAAAQPRGLIFIEGAWWPKLAALAKRQGVPVIRVSAKAGRRTRRFGRRWWYARWTAPTTLVIARDDVEAHWFAAHTAAPVEVGVNLKYLRRAAVNPLRWSRPFIVLEACEKSEEDVLIAAICQLHTKLFGLIGATTHIES